MSAITSAAGAEAQGRIMIEVQVNGKPARMAFDTGADGWMLFSAGAARLGVEITNWVEDSRLKQASARFSRSKECEVEFRKSKHKVIFDVFETPAGIKNDVDGTLGWGAIKDELLQIDALNRKVIWLDKIPEEARYWKALRINPYMDFLCLAVPGSGKYADLLHVDTGDDRGLRLSFERWQTWKMEHPNDPATLTASYYLRPGLVISEEGWAKKLTITPLTLTDIPVQEPAKEMLGSYAATNDMVIGLAGLKRLDFILDGKIGMAYLRPREEKAQPYKHNRLGAVFTPADMQHDELIARVVEHSPAWEAGIRDGDQLIRIDNRDATQWRSNPDFQPLSQFWERSAGEKLKLTVKRNNELITTNAVLRDIIGPEQVRKKK